MSRLLKFAAWAFVEFGKAGSVRTATIRITSAALCAGLAAVLALAATGCVATALWIVTLPSLGPVGAPLVIAASLSGLVFILSAAAWLITRRGRETPSVCPAPQMLLLEATRLFTAHTGAMLLAAVIAGMVAADSGRKPSARPSEQSLLA